MLRLAFLLTCRPSRPFATHADKDAWISSIQNVISGGGTEGNPQEGGTADGSADGGDSTGETAARSSPEFPPVSGAPVVETSAAATDAPASADTDAAPAPAADAADTPAPTAVDGAASNDKHPKRRLSVGLPYIPQLSGPDTKFLVSSNSTQYAINQAPPLSLSPPSFRTIFVYHQTRPAAS